MGNKQRKSRTKTPPKVNQPCPISSATPLSQFAKIPPENQKAFASERMKEWVKDRQIHNIAVWLESWSFPVLMLSAWARRITCEDLGDVALLTIELPSLTSEEKYIRMNENLRLNICVLAGYIGFMESKGKIFRSLAFGFIGTVIIALLRTIYESGFIGGQELIAYFLVEYPISVILLVIFFISVSPYLRK